MWTLRSFSTRIVITILLIVFLLGVNEFPVDGIGVGDGFVQVKPRALVSVAAGVLGIWLWFLYIKKKP